MFFDLLRGEGARRAVFFDLLRREGARRAVFFDLLRGEGARRADEGLFSLLYDETCLSLDKGEKGPSSVSLRSPASPWRSFRKGASFAGLSLEKLYGTAVLFRRWYGGWCFSSRKICQVEVRNRTNENCRPDGQKLKMVWRPNQSKATHEQGRRGEAPIQG